MTHKDYKLIASAIFEVRQMYGTWAWQMAVSSLAVALEKALKADNPKFDGDRFLAASRGE